MANSSKDEKEKYLMQKKIMSSDLNPSGAKKILESVESTKKSKRKNIRIPELAKYGHE